MSSQQTSKNNSITSQQYQTINQSLLHNREEKEFPLEEINANKVENVAEKAQIEYQKKIAKKLESQLLQTTDLSSSVFSVANTIMGTGCLALSFTISQWGPIIGSSLMIFFFFINVYTSELCIRASRLTGLVSFSSIAKKAFGRGGSLLVKLAIIVTNFGATLIYARVLGMMSYTICMIFILADHARKGTIDVNPIKMTGKVDMITSLPYIILAFVYHFNLYPIYKELVRPTKTRIRITFTLGLLIVVIIYSLTANFGYLIYGYDTKVNILDNFKKESGALDIILNLSVLTNITVSLPLVYFECRNNILLIVDETKEW